ncbi:MAG TPA: tetratricopeptide repeat protein [Pirellulales bacterium]|nr:tetratricopeptide repeat protein [Pirellulales bacterium]
MVSLAAVALTTLFLFHEQDDKKVQRWLQPLVVQSAPADQAAVPPNDEGFEARFLALLSAGKQGEAERLLGTELNRYPAALQLVDFLRRGDFKAAHDHKMKNFRAIRPAQRALFLRAACLRSRFDKEIAFQTFTAVLMCGRRTPSSRCAEAMLELDSEQLHKGPPADVDRAFADFEKLADRYPDDVIVRWMLAVQCRTWDRNELGVIAFKKILERWHPGPAIVHQTYANLLDNLGRYDEALPERRLAVALSPAWWTYDGLGNTLDNLSRFAEADAAHAIATRMNPQRALNWSNWAESLNGLGKFDEAIKKSEQALKLNPRDWRAYWMWGRALDGQGKPREALEKCLMASAIISDWVPLNQYIAELNQRLRQ